MGKPKIAVLFSGGMRADLYPPQIVQALEAFAQPVLQPEEGNLPQEKLAAAIHGCEAALTTWGSLSFTLEVLERAPSLRIIAHAAGSIRALAPPAAFDHGIVVTSAAAVIGRYVAETCLGVSIMLLRNTANHDRAMRAERSWGSPAHRAHDSLYDARVGLVGFGRVAQSFAELLRPFACEVCAYDPYVDAARARELGVELVALDDLLRSCGVVSLHAANLPENRHMIGARELSLLPDGCCFINTARGALVDHDALIAELKRGRIKAALDVTDPEPLPPDSELRDLPNTVLTPHVAGLVGPLQWHLTEAMVEELRRFFAGEPLLYQVTKNRLAHMA